MTTPTRTEFEAAAMPPLPKPDQSALDGGYVGCVLEHATPDYYTADQMQAYARTAIAAAMGWPTVPEKGE